MNTDQNEIYGNFSIKSQYKTWSGGEGRRERSKSDEKFCRQNIQIDRTSM
jgi:hypothetical protein